MIIQYESKFPDQIVLDTLKQTLRHESNLAQGRYEQFERECAAFEDKFKMSSDEFKHKFENGELGDGEAWLD